MRLLVTGGAGFIGSHFVRHMMDRPGLTHLINLDKLTYAGNLENVRDLSRDRRYRFVRGDIADPKLVQRLCREVDAIVNFAAETHVDRSIHDAAPFLHTNVIGTQILLEAARRTGIRRFLHVSTDEVYGDVAHGYSKETDSVRPSSPYSASKAAADHLALAYHRTYGLPVVITRASNTYGPYQYPEKFLPLFITHALDHQPLPLYGDGMQIRDWLHVSDHCAGIEAVLRRGCAGEIYNLGGGNQLRNRDVARRVLRCLGRPETLIRRVTDRPGHDRRYALSIAKARRELGWTPKIRFAQGLHDLIDWYIDHRDWWEAILTKSKRYRAYYKAQYQPSPRPSSARRVGEGARRAGEGR